MNKINVALVIIVLSLLIGCNKYAESNCINYPTIEPHKTIEKIYGKIITDDYQFLENDTTFLITSWLKNQNKLTDSVLNKISNRTNLSNNLYNVIYASNVRGGYPRAVGELLLFLKIYMKEQKQEIIVKNNILSKEVVLFSTESINNSKNTYSIDYFEPSYNGKYLVFGLSVNGDELSKMQIIDIESKKILPEIIERVPFGQPQWINSSEGFFYTQLKEFKTANDYSTLYENTVVKFHKLASDVNNDLVILSKEKNKNLNFNSLDYSTVCTYKNSNKIISYTSRGSTLYKSLRYINQNDVFSKKQNWIDICKPDEKVSVFALHDNDLYYLSFKENSNGTLKKTNLNNNNYKTVAVAKDEVFEDFIINNNALFLKKIKNGISYLDRIDLLTNEISKINLPFSGDLHLKPFFDVANSFLNSNDLFFSMESWSRELAIYKYNTKYNIIEKTTLRHQSEYGNLDNIIVKELEVEAHDGEKIPLSLVYMKGVEFNGENPTLLEAYGAYGISNSPTFMLSRIVWLQKGGVYAVAHVRGGGEKGEKWYKGGFKATKSNSWKDFVSCAEYLISKKITSSKKLAAKGTSAGVITVGRAITQKPELFKAAILEVGTLNMMRSGNLSNTFGVSEFGNIKDSVEAAYLYEMDVYHHIKPKTKYPALLVTAGLNDTRVDWWQPAKAVAKWQAYANDFNCNTILFKINTGGHFGSSDIVTEETDYDSFLFWQLNHKDFKYK